MANNEKASGTSGSPKPESEPDPAAKELSALDRLKGTVIPKGPLAGVYETVEKRPDKDRL
jgi:hypothetical protein